MNIQKYKIHILTGLILLLIAIVGSFVLYYFVFLAWDLAITMSFLVAVGLGVLVAWFRVVFKSMVTKAEPKRAIVSADISYSENAKNKLEAIIEKEKSRKKIEKYKINIIGGWIYVPLGVFGLSIIYFFNIWFSIDWPYYIPGIIGVLLFIISKAYERKWKKRLIAKLCIYKENIGYQFEPGKYKHESLYTDSSVDFYLYQIIKWATYVYSGALIILLGVYTYWSLIFLSLGHISF